MIRSDEIALTRTLRRIAVRLADVVPMRGTFCLFCRRETHRKSCVWMAAVKARASILADDVEQLRLVADTARPETPKPILACEWCGSAATATDSDGDSCCANCVDEAVAREAAE